MSKLPFGDTVEEAITNLSVKFQRLDRILKNTRARVERSPAAESLREDVKKLQDQRDSMFRVACEVLTEHFPEHRGLTQAFIKGNGRITNESFEVKEEKTPAGPVMDLGRCYIYRLDPRYVFFTGSTTLH